MRPMKSLTSLGLLLVAVQSTLAGNIFPRLSPNLPSSAFPKFKTIPLSEAIRFNSSNSHGDSGSRISSTAGELDSQVFADSSAASCSNPQIRYEWRQYSASNRAAFISAMKCLMRRPPSGRFPPATNRYEDLVRLHQQYMPNVHNNAKFLIWHRYYVWTFEQVLRSECGFTSPMPWWDETLDAGRFSQSDMFTNLNYFGRLPGQINGQATCVVTGPFAGTTCHIGPGSADFAHCLSRGVDESLTSQCNSGYVNQCTSRGTYDDMRQCIEFGPHGYGHNGIGGVMADVYGSVSDPVFWMHHSFIDHCFRMWQNIDPAHRTTSINGNDAQGQSLNMDTIIYMGGIRPNVRVRDIMNTMSGTVIAGVPFCYRYNY